MEVMKDKLRNSLELKNIKDEEDAKTIECEILDWVHIQKTFTGIIDTIWNSIALMLIL